MVLEKSVVRGEEEGAAAVIEQGCTIPGWKKDSIRDVTALFVVTPGGAGACGLFVTVNVGVRAEHGSGDGPRQASAGGDGGGRVRESGLYGGEEDGAAASHRGDGVGKVRRAMEKRERTARAEGGFSNGLASVCKHGIGKIGGRGGGLL
ncbi:hypothetical protein GOBAR_DD09456 [Gossypium barbadense]|nr:hypothetical protein GOBAR_DD09456 [Gossypium barbadense]